MEQLQTILSHVNWLQKKHSISLQKKIIRTPNGQIFYSAQTKQKLLIFLSISTFLASRLQFFFFAAEKAFAAGQVMSFAVSVVVVVGFFCVLVIVLLFGRFLKISKVPTRYLKGALPSRMGMDESAGPQKQRSLHLSRWSFPGVSKWFHRAKPKSISTVVNPWEGTQEGLRGHVFQWLTDIWGDQQLYASSRICVAVSQFRRRTTGPGRKHNKQVWIKSRSIGADRRLLLRFGRPKQGCEISLLALT